MKYIIGNWKSNKNHLEVKDWFQKFSQFFVKEKATSFNNLEIIVCPPYIHLFLTKNLRDKYKLPIKLGAQDISPFDSGAYTGAISAKMLSEFVEYVIIGHSERRTHFGEDDKILSQKVTMAKDASLEPIFCIPDKTSFIPDSISIIGYEPVWAIGTGKTDTPENADGVAVFVKQKNPGSALIYGGSVNPENALNFLTTKHIDGILIGGASLNPIKFWEIIVNAAKI